MTDRKETLQAESLSCLLDDMALGRRPDCEDAEIRQLVDVAVIVKSAYSEQADIPACLLNEMADQLASELKRNSKKRSVFWRSALGAAAAVCIAALLQFMPPAVTDDQLARQTPAEMPSHPVTVQQDANANISLPQDAPLAMAPKFEGEKTGADAGDRSLRHQDTSSQAATGNDGVQPEPARAAKQIQTKQARAQSEPQQNAAATQPALAMLVIPGLEAQSVIIDPAGGVIRQVYNTGSDTLTITQRIRQPEAARQGAEIQSQQQPARPFAKAAVKTSNRVTVVVDDYEITIEGEKPVDELKKIAQSLVLKK